MILQSLNQLYERLTAEPEYAVAPPGYSLQNIAFVVVLKPDGCLYEIQSLKDEKGKDKKLLVPGGDKPRGGITKKSVHNKTGFLRNDSAFLLGRRVSKSEYVKAEMEFNAFKEKHCQIEDEIKDAHYSAVCRYLENWNAADLTEEQKSTVKGGSGVFKIVGELQYIHDRTAVREWWQRQHKTKSTEKHFGLCLVTGERELIARTHEPNFKGIEGGQSSGAPLVSYNCDAFESYGKTQSYNASVSEAAAFRYCTALNAILSGPQKLKHTVALRNPSVKLSNGDKKKSTTIVFWTELPTETEDWLAQMFSGNLDEVQDDHSLTQTRILLQALRNGSGELRALGDDPSTPVHILGLAPNAGRLSVRFWHTGSLGELFDKLKSHHDALRLYWCWDPFDKKEPPEFPPAWMLLRETARESKDIPPLLGGALMRAILEGTPYPDALANAVVRRIRADRHINYLRAAILKAWLTRKPNHQGGVPVSLDIEQFEPGYRLGRLFAALEKTQERAQPAINSTIRERFYSSASATPSMVFPRLLRTYQHHLAKLNPGEKVNREKLIQEIMDGISVMPPNLNLESQAQFAIGYYHQRKALFGGESEQAENSNEQETVNEEQE